MQNYQFIRCEAIDTVKLSLKLSELCWCFNLMQSRPKLSLLPDDARITSKEYKEIVDKGESHMLLDVRPAHHFRITSIPHSVNIPLSVLEGEFSKLDSALTSLGEGSALYVVCRRGNDSQRAVQLLRNKGFVSAKDIIGGLESWAQDVDPNFPAY